MPILPKENDKTNAVGISQIGENRIRKSSNKQSLNRNSSKKKLPHWLTLIIILTFWEIIKGARHN